MEIPEKVRNSERHAHGWKDREISERMSIRMTMFRFAGKSPKIWKKSDHGESPVRPEKARSPMEKVRNGEIPMGKVRNGKSPMEKVRWRKSDGNRRKSDGKSPVRPEKVLRGDFPMEKVRNPEKVRKWAMRILILSEIS